MAKSAQRIKAFEFMLLPVEDLIGQLNLVVNATEFAFQKHDPTASAIGNQALMDIRRQLIEFTIRGDNVVKRKYIIYIYIY